VIFVTTDAAAAAAADRVMLPQVLLLAIWALSWLLR
jgi:hypothetical protein